MSDTFYDELAPYYHLILADWERSINRQASELDAIIRSNWGENVKSVLDVACGIGTQSIGLARRGYTVTASDLSPNAVERAKAETDKRGLEIDYSVADMRKVSSAHQFRFDLLICCDNALPHLLSDCEIGQALGEFYRCLNPGGGCLITLRDYEKEEKTNLKIRPYKVQVEDGIRYVLFQIWDFNGDIYELSLYLVVDNGQPMAETKIFRTQYYAVPLSKVLKLMEEAGFVRVKRLDSDFYQPVIIGTKGY